MAERESRKSTKKNRHSKRNKENDKFSFNGKVFVFVLCKYYVERIKPNFSCYCCCCCCAKYFNGFFCCRQCQWSAYAFVLRGCFPKAATFPTTAAAVCVFVCHLVWWQGWSRFVRNCQEGRKGKSTLTIHSHALRQKKKYAMEPSDENSSINLITFVFMHIYVELNGCMRICFFRR